MEKRLLITGGSHAELPMILAAKQLGWYVISTGNDVGGLGHKEADKYVQGDFSDKEFVLKLAKKENVQAMISGCNDFAYLSTAYACEKLGLSGHDSYETAQIVHHKNEFRKMTRGLGIRTPQVVECMTEEQLTEACKKLGFPLVIKPIDLTGGKGVTICQDYESAIAAFKDAKAWTRENFVIAEECIVGSNHGTTMLIKDKKVVWYIFDNEQYYLNKYLVAGACSPSDISQSAMFQLINDVQKIAEHLNLVDGLFHTQFMIEGNGMPVLIDPCRRAPGDLYVLLAKYVTEVDYPMEIVKAETGQGLNDSYYSECNFIARECIMSDTVGVIKEICIDKKVEDKIIHKLIWAKPGDEIEDILKYKAGILIMKFESQLEMQEILENYHELVKIELVEK